MQPDFDSMDLFCRINVQAEMPHQEFVAFIAQQYRRGQPHNSVRSQTLDILVDENTPTTLSIENREETLACYVTWKSIPIEGVEPKDYVASIGRASKHCGLPVHGGRCLMRFRGSPGKE